MMKHNILDKLQSRLLLTFIYGDGCFFIRRREINDFNIVAIRRRYVRVP